jgi:flagellar protein FlgJ
MDIKIASPGLDADSMRLMKDPTAGIGGASALALAGDKSMKSKEKIANLAREFESVFMNQMLKAMRQTIPKNNLVNGGHAEDIYSSLLDEEFSRRMAYSQQGGISQALANQLNLVMEKQAGKGAPQDPAGQSVKEPVKLGTAKTE